MNLKDRVAIVTGAGRGIGQAIAVKLASHGARIVVNDLDAEPAAETVALIEKAGGQVAAVVGSVTAPELAAQLVDTAVGDLGGLDIIVNNAGYTWDAVIQKTTDEQWAAILDVHLTAPFRLLRAVQPVLKRLSEAERAAGTVRHRKVVNVSSISGLAGNPGQANYAAAKAGIVGLTKTLAKEWGRYAVNVNAVAYGVIGTRLTDPTGPGHIAINGRQLTVGINHDIAAGLGRAIPLGRPGTVDEAAGAAYLLCTPEADYITGEVLVCAGGYAF
ncbi:SDR family NAD(P)-dependent oxidoreductase [Micromonospora echinaurantiaca]|uniref:SDR family NAD(P)-dependent oxidoreductase n=1 Tax=Micromonospora echinaurantiaca TaxID=47857 RepID=UPI0037179A79